MDFVFARTLWITLGTAGLVVLSVRILEIMWAKLRQVSAMSSPRDKQAYWKTSQWSWMPSMKKHIIYAPLWRKRHNREFRLSSAVNVGTLPSRLHLILIVLYFVCNIAYMVAVNWAAKNKWAPCAEIRGRSGTLAMVNMVPLIVFAGRNNPLIGLLKISFDTYNLLHRWLGRIVVFQVIVHIVAWAIPKITDNGWRSIMPAFMSSPFMVSGYIGGIAAVILVVASFSPVRHAFYETFLATHILLALVLFVCSWIHCATAGVAGGLPQLPWIMTVVALWFADRFARFFRLMYTNWSKNGFTEAICEAMEGDATKVTIRLPRYVRIQPGTHAYLRFSGICAWESHPFSIAWTEHSSDHELPLSEKEPTYGLSGDRKHATTSVSFIIGAHTGMTRKLHDRARKAPTGVLRIGAAMEGPYAGHHNLDSYGHVVLFAGSTGITHQISYIRHLMHGYNAGTVATRRITMVWIIRSASSLEWIRSFMDDALQIPNRKDIFRCQIYVTRPENPRDIVDTSSSVKMFPGRPNVPLILIKEVAEQIGAMAVSVCGPGGLADDVRGAARAVQGDNVVDFIEESFTW